MPARISAWAVYDVFDVKDGEKVFVGVVSDSQWVSFCRDFGLAHWAGDTSLNTNNARVDRREEIIPQLRGLFAGFTKQGLMLKLEKTGLPFAPIQRPEDLFDDPHLRAAGGLLDMILPDGGEVSLPALPLAIDGQRIGDIGTVKRLTQRAGHRHGGGRDQQGHRQDRHQPRALVAHEGAEHQQHQTADGERALRG